jgi:hypothetical protein
VCKSGNQIHPIIPFSAHGGRGRGEGVIKGEGMVVLGCCCRPWALVVLGVGGHISRMCLPFVGGGL